MCALGLRWRGPVDENLSAAIWTRRFPIHRRNRLATNARNVKRRVNLHNRLQSFSVALIGWKHCGVPERCNGLRANAFREKEDDGPSRGRKRVLPETRRAHGLALSEGRSGIQRNAEGGVIAAEKFQLASARATPVYFASTLGL